MKNAKDNILNRLDITRSHLNLILSGKNNASFSLAKKMASVIGGGVQRWMVGDSESRMFSFIRYAEKRNLHITTHKGRPQK